MPTIDYADWFRRELEKRRQQNLFINPTGVMPQGYVDTPTSLQQIGGTFVGIGTDIAKQEAINSARDYLAGSAAGATTAGATAGAGTTAANTGAATGGATAAGTSLGSTIAGGAGAAYGGYNLSRDIVGRRGATAGAMSGATTGAGIGTMILPGIGTAIGAGLGALAGATLGSIFSPRKKNLEKERWERLKAYGFDVPKPDWVDTKDAALKAQDKTLAKDFVGYNEQGQWVNNKFANSGKDSDLKAQDIQEFATNFETFGRPYQVLSTEKRQQIMDIALQNNLVKERKGTVDIEWTPETFQKAQDILMGDKAVQDYLASQPSVYKWSGDYKWNAAKPAPSATTRKA